MSFDTIRLSAAKMAPVTFSTHNFAAARDVEAALSRLVSFQFGQLGLLTLMLLLRLLSGGGKDNAHVPPL